MAGVCIWITGLPGSGKTGAARELCGIAKDEGGSLYHLEMDAVRKKMFPDPEYTTEGREKAYGMLEFMAELLTYAGLNVVIDATAHKREFRRKARQRIPDYTEVLIDASLETCMERESHRKGGKVISDMYEKALRRKRTGEEFPELGEVIGVDVEYEKDPRAELTVSSEEHDARQIGRIIWEYIGKKFR